MPEDQLPLAFGSGSTRPSGGIPQLRDEIARVWGMPLGERVEIVFRPGFHFVSISGRLELGEAPDYPWDARRPLALRIDGQSFSARDIAHWKLV